MSLIPSFLKRKKKVRLKPDGILPEHDWFSLLNQTGVIIEVERQSWLVDANRGKRNKLGHPLPHNYVPADHTAVPQKGFGESTGFVVVQFDTVTGKRTIHCRATDVEPLK